MWFGNACKEREFVHVERNRGRLTSSGKMSHTKKVRFAVLSKHMGMEGANI